MGILQLLRLGAWSGSPNGIECNHAAIAAPVTSVQGVNARVRAERMSLALAVLPRLDAGHDIPLGGPVAFRACR